MYSPKNRKLRKFASTNRNFITWTLSDMHHRKTYMHINFQKNRISRSVKTRCTRGARVFFSVTRMRSSNSARINKFDFRTEKSCSVHMTVFEVVAGHNVVNWMQLLT